MQFHKILRVLGIVQQVIDLGTRPQFAEQYGLTGDDEAAVRDLFCDELLEFFEGQKTQINVQGHDPQLLLYRHGQRIAPDQVEQFMVEGFEIFKRFCHSEDAWPTGTCGPSVIRADLVRLPAQEVCATVRYWPVRNPDRTATIDWCFRVDG